MSTSRGPSLDVLRDPNLAKLIGITGVGLMAWLIAKATPTLDVPGGWAVTGAVRDLTKELGWSPSKFISETRSLQAAGLIVIAKGQRLGKGMGSAQNRYFLTHEEWLPSPHRPTGGDNPSVDGNGSLQNRSFQNQHRHLVPVSSPGVSALETSTHPVVVPLSTTAGSADVPNVETPPVGEPVGFLQKALARVGWVGPTPAGDPAVLAAVANHLADHPERWSRPGGMLNSLVRQNGLETFAKVEKCLPSDPSGALAQHGATTDAPHMMSFQEYTALTIEYPEWEQAVHIEAQRVASMEGIKVTAGLWRTVALRIPVPSAQTETVDRTS